MKIIYNSKRKQRIFNIIILGILLYAWGRDVGNQSCGYDQKTGCFSQKMHEKDTESILVKPNLEWETVPAEQHGATE